MTAKTCGCSPESCGCCEGTQALTPEPVVNRPGLSALAARVGTHGTFFETMKARLATMLPGLTTRDPSDPAIALLDSWAMVADVLSFYQERIANEGYLRTATERRSVLELAKLVGYAPRPGVASTVFLAYTLDDNQTDPVEIPQGARAQSIPGPGEQPQTFEISEKLLARSEWSNLKPRSRQPQQITASPTPNANGMPPIDLNTDTIYFHGTTTQLKPNDPLLFVSAISNDRVLRHVESAEADFTNNSTKVILQKTITPPVLIPGDQQVNIPPIVNPGASGEFDRIVEPLSKSFNPPPSSSAALPRLTSVALAPDRDALPQLVTAFKPEIGADIYKAWASAAITDPPAVSVHAFRVQATPFGSNAPLRPITDSKGQVVGRDEWPLAGAATIRIEFVSMNRPVTVLFTQGTQTSQAIFLPRSSVPVPLGNSEKCVFNKETTGMVYTFTFSGMVDRKIKITARPDDGDFHMGVQIDSNEEVEIRRGQTLHYSTGDQQIMLSLSMPPEFPSRELGSREAGSREVLTVEDSSLLPLDAKNLSILNLDAQYPQVIPGTWVAVVRGADTPPLLTRIKSSPNAVKNISKADYGITGKSTQLTLDEAWLTMKDTDLSSLRETTVFAQSEQLPLAEKPYQGKEGSAKNADGSASDVMGDTIELDRLYDGLKSGRWMIVSGERTDIKTSPDDPNAKTVAGVQAGELVMLEGVEQSYDPKLPGDQVHSTLHLANALAYTYKRATVTIYGNVVKATQGETRLETLGAGDGSKALQAFVLKQPPLTFVPAPTVTGVESTLKVYVNDVEWHETDALARLGPQDHKFITKSGDDGTTTVIFGNGNQGARLPTGVENVKSVYRNGLGKAGNVQAEQISLLMTRPLGVKGVINPLRASGGADQERSDQIRENAPIPVLALDRLVSVQDYADFTRAFAGIAKAEARHLSDGQRELVHVTIAGADDIPIDPNSDLYRNLLISLRKFGDPDLPVLVDLRELLVLVLSAKVKLDPDHLWDPVSAEIRQMLLDTFGFQKRALGQSVWLSEIVSQIQNIEGVAYLQVETFGGIPEKMSDPKESDPKATGQRRLATLKRIASDVSRMPPGRPAQSVPVNLADFQQGSFHPAQLAIFTPAVPATLILNQIS
jgi:hypothetical protein